MNKKRMDTYLMLYRLALPRRYRSYLRRAGGDVDMCHECLKYGTFYEEYKLYGFADKSDVERREYLTDAVRDRICRRINNAADSRRIMNKYSTYQLFSKFYRREAWMLDSVESIDRLCEVSSQRGCVVVKPVDSCGGRGVRLLQAGNPDEWRKLFHGLLDERTRWIVEERIIQDEAMAQWNPDTVNTIRMNTVFHKGHLTHYVPFILVGRKGSFVNNGAQGGVFASIDAASGRVITDAFDEEGNSYAFHPDSGVAFREAKIPRWNELLEITEAMARMLPGMTYIAWDMALTPEGWAMVEANRGEFVAQQRTLGRGLCKEFESMVFD